MSDKKKNEGWEGSAAHTLSNAIPQRDPKAPKLPYVTRRPKRRRKGQLNDGEWAPGYGPDAQAKRHPKV